MSEDKRVFETRWFTVLSREVPGSQHPHYVVDSPDFVSIIALDDVGRLLLVRQFRQGVQAVTLELPSGHVEPGETPEETARKELLEETGYVAEKFELIADLSPSTARFNNRIWCFLARNARPQPQAEIEKGLELVLYEEGMKSLLNEKSFCSAAHYGALCVALLNGSLKA